MFTGIVEEVGRIERIEKGRHSAVLTIGADKVLEDLKIGDSVAVNGICLTATGFSQSSFTADVMHETLNRTALFTLKKGSSVNLERAMAAEGRFGGHIVAGHIDGTGKIIGVRRDDTAIWYTVQAAQEILRYMVEKGSIAIDGISLTVAEVFEDSFSISAIPHTVRATILSGKKAGDVVNLETDIIGKYVEKLMGSKEEQQTKSVITKEFLTRHGY